MTQGDATPASAETVRLEEPEAPRESAAAHAEPAPRAASIARTIDRDERRAIARGMVVGLWIWLALFALDAFMGVVAYPGGPLGLYLVLRLIGAAAVVGTVRLARAKGAPMFAVRWGYRLTMMLICVLVSVMAVSMGGLRSPYLHGMSLAILFMAATLPGPAWATVARVLPCALAFPATMAVAALFVPRIARDFIDRETMVAFAANYAFVLASVVVSAVVGSYVQSARDQLAEARRLGRYRLTAPIGKGGMGDVWLAWDPALRRNVALKILRDPGEGDDRALVRFEREALAASRLSSPHTVRVFDFGASDDGVYYLAMEYLEGMDLGRLVEAEGPLPPARAARLAAQACLSLAEAHAAGVVHRDIKPANLIAARVGGEDDVLKVVDFGVARVLEPTDAGATRTGAFLGTPAYAAPEVALGRRADARSDVYSLGATLYFLLTGTSPFPGATAAAVLTAHVAATPVPPSERLGRPLPPRLEAAVLRCLEKKPEDRFASAEALRAALETPLDD